MAKKPNNVTHVEFAPDEPVEPVWSTRFSDKAEQDEASRIWRGACAEVRRLGALTPGNGLAIRRYTVVAIEYLRQEARVAKDGAILTSEETGGSYYSLHWTALQSADATMRQLESELGIAPLRRSRVGRVQKKGGKPRPADAYLRPPAS